MTSAEREPITESGAEPPVGSKSRAPAQGVKGGAKLLKMKAYRGLDIQRKGQTGIMPVF